MSGSGRRSDGKAAAPSSQARTNVPPAPFGQNVGRSESRAEPIPIQLAHAMGGEPRPKARRVDDSFKEEDVDAGEDDASADESQEDVGATKPPNKGGKFQQVMSPNTDRDRRDPAPDTKERSGSPGHLRHRFFMTRKDFLQRIRIFENYKQSSDNLGHVWDQFEEESNYIRNKAGVETAADEPAPSCFVSLPVWQNIERYFNGSIEGFFAGHPSERKLLLNMLCSRWTYKDDFPFETGRRMEERVQQILRAKSDHQELLIEALLKSDKEFDAVCDSVFSNNRRPGQDATPAAHMVNPNVSKGDSINYSLETSRDTNAEAHAGQRARFPPHLQSSSPTSGRERFTREGSVTKAKHEQDDKLDAATLKSHHVSILTFVSGWDYRLDLTNFPSWYNEINRKFFTIPWVKLFFTGSGQDRLDNFSYTLARRYDSIFHNAFLNTLGEDLINEYHQISINLERRP